MHPSADQAASRALPWTAKTLPSHASAAVHSCNALYASPPWCSDGVQWQWQACAEPARSAPREHAVRSAVTLRAGADELGLALFDDIVGLDEPSIDHWAAIDEPVRSVMWTLAHERLLDVLARLFGRDWIVRSVAEAPLELQPCDRADLRAGFVCRAGAMLLRGVATMNAALAQVVLARSTLERQAVAHDAAPDALPDASTTVWAQGRVRMTCVIDRVPARGADLAALRPGALVLLDNPTLAAQLEPPRSLLPDGAGAPWEQPGGEPAHVHLVLGQRELSCELRGWRLLVLRSDMAGEATMIQPIQPSATADELLDAAAPDAEPGTHLATHLAEHTPVTLSFEAGSVSLPLAQLACVREGYTFFLPQGLDAATIRVLANGVLVGSGQLVRIDDVVGVQLTHLETKR